MQSVVRELVCTERERHRIGNRGAWTDLRFKQVHLAAVWGADRTRGTCGDREASWESLAVTQTREDDAWPQAAERRW